MADEISSLRTVHDAIRYCRKCLSDAPADQPKSTTAGWIVGIHHASFNSKHVDLVEEWCHEEPLFEEMLSNAESLELETDDMRSIERYWNKIQEAMAQLEEKYHLIA